MDLISVGAFLCFGKCITGILPVDLLELHLYLIITTVWKTVLQIMHLGHLARRFEVYLGHLARRFFYRIML